ncbi:tetratricopeptide repeat-containing sensor histidine kinase [Flavobacterium sp. WW92]|uniref:tetratricopeptide repeat-containing sensor histidine kinase n=1 Tax=unclassified Flavobacterium TaxID=196869 RepID=UPI002224C433|nr:MULTISPECIES: tetratricopeptide repeat-containing sensor histidine kinase [unclassified Flavobacterium]WDO13937.1 tetratricopeptide repeat-containing sensor histidine kinase [Flavobacterium sp. WW92]
MPRLVPLKYVLLATSFVLFSLSSYSQTQEIRSIQKKLPHVKDSISYVNSINRIGMLMHLKSPDSSLVYAMNARAVAGRIGYKKGAVDAENVIGIALALKGLNREANKIFGEVLASYEAMGDRPNTAQLYMNFASIQMQLGNPKRAIEYSRKALEIGREIPNDSIMSKVYANYCIANPELFEDSVQYYLGRSNKIAERLKDEQVLIGNKQILALFYLRRGLGTIALPLLESSLAEARTVKLERLQLVSLNFLGEYYAGNGNPTLALHYMEEQLKLAEANGYDELKAPVLMSVLRFAKMLGNSEKEKEITEKIIAAQMQRMVSLEKFVGDYVHYNQIQENNRNLERSQKISRQTIAILGGFSLLCAALSLLLWRAFRKIRRDSKKKAALYDIIDKKNASLEEADSMKSNLVSILAHDFRSPLISTLYMVRLLERDTELTQADKDTFYRTISDDINGILENFDATLQWIKRQLGEFKINPEPVNMRELLDEAISGYSMQFKEKNITVINNAPEAILAESDKEMLQFVNRNLLSNALKFSPENKTIILDAAKQDSEIVISVEDEGTGLSNAQLEKLFSISSKGGTMHDGAGIALSFSKDFIVKLGGRIWAENREAGGSLFSYAVPSKN